MTGYTGGPFGPFGSPRRQPHPRENYHAFAQSLQPRGKRAKQLYPLLAWRTREGRRSAYALMESLSVEGLPEEPDEFYGEIRLFRKLRADERYRLCAKFVEASDQALVERECD